MTQRARRILDEYSLTFHTENEMLTLQQIKAKVHDHCLDMRAMDRLVNTKEFAEAFNLNPNNDRLLLALKEGETGVVEAWIKRTLSEEIGLMSMSQLRAKAASLNIMYYTTFTKSELIGHILKVKALNDSQTQKASS